MREFKEFNQEFLEPEPNRHALCYIDQREEQEMAECTHKPKINKKSKSLIENRVLANIKKRS